MKMVSKKILVSAIIMIVVVIATILFLLFVKNGPASFSIVEARLGNVTKKINLTGQVKASQGVDLAFEQSGKIVRNYVNVGDKIYAGQPLLAIDSSILQSQLRQAEAQLDALNMDTVKSKTDASLQTLYSSALASSQKSATVAKDVLLVMSDIQYNYFNTQNQQGIELREAKIKAVNSLLGEPNAGDWTSESISELNGGVFAMVQDAVKNPSQENTDSGLLALQTALQDLEDFINVMPISTALNSTERASMSSAKTNINLEIITTSNNIQAIATQKINNSATVTTAGSQIEATKASIDVIKTQLSKTVITSLFAGQVDKNDAVVGSMVSAGTPIITISNNNLEVQVGIPEIDLVDAKVGNKADVTLDAYGNNIVFSATVASVDSAQSTLNGVPVYKARLKFVNNDERIKPGMTANITIISESRENVLLVPKTAVIQKQGKYFVVVKKGGDEKEIREVSVGIYDEKNIEITSGLIEGEKVVSY